MRILVPGGTAFLSAEIVRRAVAMGHEVTCLVGLIGGPIDGSERYGYWPARFAKDGSPAILPDIEATHWAARSPPGSASAGPGRRRAIAAMWFPRPGPATAADGNPCQG